jgi:D-amino-acid dehydrogenase
LNDKQIVIIGGGLQGLATAFTLLNRGEDVLILEKDEDVATAASFANAGMLTPSQSSPWNSPNDILQILKGIGKKDSPMSLNPLAIPSLFFWGLKFLFNSTPTRFDRITSNLFSLGNFSKHLTQKIREDFDISYDESLLGTLKIYRDAQNFDKASELQTKMFSGNKEFSIMDTESLTNLEPALKEIRNDLAGGIHFPNDETGDAYKFCKKLEELIRSNGGRILTNTNINKILVNKGKVNCVVTDRAILQTKRVVVCAGSWSRRLLKQTKLNLPVRPVKGYSLTYDTAGLNNKPNISLVDESVHTAVTPFHNRIRVAGTAEFVNFDDSIHPKREKYLNKMLESVYPSLYKQIDKTSGKIWHGFRPMSADGLPFIGKTKIDGLFVNCGQGHLGWTLAMGSAELLADQIQDKESEIDINPYLASRSL